MRSLDDPLFAVMAKAEALLPLSETEIALLNANPSAVNCIVDSLAAAKRLDNFFTLKRAFAFSQQAFNSGNIIRLETKAAASQGAPLKAYAHHADWNGEHLAIEFKPQGENVWNVVWEFSGVAPLIDWAERGVSSISLKLSIDDEERLVAELDYNQDDALTFSTPYLLIGIDPASFVASGKLIIRENKLTQHDE